jgi:starch synthase (maltosyl-transferring)
MAHPEPPRGDAVASAARVVIEAIRPQVDGGRYPIKRVVGEAVVVEADLLVEGHQRLAGVVLYRPPARDLGEGSPPASGAAGAPWRESPLEPVTSAVASSAVPPGGTVSTSASRMGPFVLPDNDVWRGAFVVDAVGLWEYTLRAWVDDWATWATALRRRWEASVGARAGRDLDPGGAERVESDHDHDLDLDLRAGAALVAAAADRASGTDRASLRQSADRLATAGEPTARATLALDVRLHALMRAHADRGVATTAAVSFWVMVEPARAAFSSWYEMFPRSCGPAGTHGTLRDAAERLAYVADMGFDVVYLPPIHPIGLTHRKGADNRLRAEPGDPGSPWAIGSPEGGHASIHPALGTIADFRHFLATARAHGIEVALDVALQTSPDHPYVREHPEWFGHRADGSIQYAENPPKKYEDIYPFDFWGPGGQALWNALRGIFLHWIGEGVRIFRVDNPHTKPIAFWQWCLTSIKARHPEVIFLAEAFTRPKLMNVLAKIGFSQSYTYFTWRTTKAELTDYITSLGRLELREFFRPSFWPNTPDILPEQLQVGTRATFIARAVLAATLSGNWGVYGPAFELQEHVARAGSEEYAENEKYQLRSWPLDRPDSLRPILRRLNQIRRETPALQRFAGTVFHETGNDALICYSRVDASFAHVILVVVNLDPHHPQSGWLTLDLEALALAPDAQYQVHDLLGDARYLWQGARPFVALDPRIMPAHVFRIRHRARTERAFEYFA